MPGPRLTLYNWWRSSASHRVRIALALKNVEYEYVSVNLVDGEHTGAVHRARSPTGYVPCLEIDGVPYVESVAIVELLDELFPSPPLYPAAPEARARVRALVEIVNSGIQPLQNSSVTPEVRRLGGDEGAARWIDHFVSKGLGALQRAMDENARRGIDGPHAYGSAPTAADVFLVPQVVSARRFRVGLEPFPRVVAAFDAAMRLEPFQRAAPDRQVDYTGEVQGDTKRPA
jgi:maleylpyruvate isomerase